MFSIGSASKFFSFYKALPSYHQTHSTEGRLHAWLLLFRDYLYDEPGIVNT